MNMFSRSDKFVDSTAGSATPARDKAEVPPPSAAETKRSQSYAAPTDFAPTPARTASVISKALKITGQLESTEDIQVDGEVDGDVRGLAVKIGSSAKVKGTVYGEEVELAGAIDGKIEAKKVILTSTAHMSGDIVHQEIKIELGAYVDGHCRPEFGKAGAKSAPTAVKPAATVSVTAVREKTAEFGSRA